MKFGLLTYNYKTRAGYVANYCNIGDYVQSIAARQFLPNVDVLVDRDSVASYKGDPIKLIMNGWWHLYEGNEITSEAITPLYVSFHLVNPKGLTSKAIEHLKKYAPIGCRDIATVNNLQAKGIEAYLSSCLTTTLGRTYFVSERERTNTVYFVDCDFLNPNNSVFHWIKRLRSLPLQRLHKLQPRVFEIIRDYMLGGHVETRTHRYPPSVSAQEGFQMADQFLQDYSKARLVVTSRLHCALPVAAMGVPVLFVRNQLDDKRFAGTLDCVCQIGYNSDNCVYRDGHDSTKIVERLTSSFPSLSPTLSVKEFAKKNGTLCDSFIES